MGRKAHGRSGNSGPQAQKRRKIVGPIGLPGEPNGVHVPTPPGKKSTCRCGRCCTQ